MLPFLKFHCIAEIHNFAQILKQLAFISEQGTIELKGRVACELHTQEVLVTELLFRNILSGMEPAEIAALLSCIVFQQVKLLLARKVLPLLYIFKHGYVTFRQSVVSQIFVKH